MKVVRFKGNTIMPQTAGRLFGHFKMTAKTALVGPQILAFVPALTLGGYWFGGEALMLFMAIVVPATLGLVGLFTPIPPTQKHRGAVDSVTRLPLRDSLISALDGAFCAESESGLRTACMAVEIDDFGRYRDQHGDLAADRILKQVADRIEGALRDGDVVSRIDKATFAIALAPVRRLDLESMIQLSARLQHAVAQPLLIDGLRLYATASVGFCLPRRASEKTGLASLDAAEMALVEAQSSGAGAIRAYCPQPRMKRVVRAGLVGEVAEALDNGQIKPWYQPQICTDTGAISGMEALARWEHPGRGVILPGAFLPAIAAAGLNDRLGEVILFNAFGALQAWDAAGLGIPTVGVNFSGDELSDPRLCDRIKWEADRFDLPLNRINVEILETVISRAQNDTITRNIARLAEMGCGIDLDDFGTGHASIANIRRFSVNRIKIDRSFIARIDTDPEQQKMLTAILEMAERLGIQTLAEGVETLGENTILTQLGCGHVQGYRIARPMPFSETLDWIRSHRKKSLAGPTISRQTG
jgi:diguanylate cyclase (GGDEF)-like protein